MPVDRTDRARTGPPPGLAVEPRHFAPNDALGVFDGQRQHFRPWCRARRMPRMRSGEFPPVIDRPRERRKDTLCNLRLRIGRQGKPEPYPEMLTHAGQLQAGCPSVAELVAGPAGHQMSGEGRSVVLIALSGLVWPTGKFETLSNVQPRRWLFLVLSGLATGASWL